MSLTPPNGSQITVDNSSGYQQVTIPNGKISNTKYLVGIVFIIWLVFWVKQLIALIPLLLAGVLSLFSILWLIILTLGGLIAIKALVRICKGSVPQRLSLRKPNLEFDTGIAPLPAVPHKHDLQGQAKFRKALFAKRTTHTITPQDLSTLKLRETQSTTKLTVDIGVERLELAANVSEVEREWLFEFLAHHYSEVTARK